MRIPIVQGVIERRMLINYRVDPAVLARLLPRPFRPQLVRGQAIAGICLIRLAGIRPRGLPAWIGINSENAAHRFAVEWDSAGETHCGVYIPRRDTSSRWNALAGGRIFPGVHHRATFEVTEAGDEYGLRLDSLDDHMHLEVHGRRGEAFPADSVFADLSAASQFFAAGSIGYSGPADATSFDGLELRTNAWRVEPLADVRVESSYFDDAERFPAGSIELDCALLMRDIPHEWHPLPALAAD